MHYIYNLLLHINKRAEQLLQTNSDTADSLYTKKLYFLSSAGVFILVSGLTLSTALLHLPVLTSYGISILLFYIVSLAAFIRVKRYAEVFYAVNLLYIILTTFIAILRLGGLLHSGGLLFVGLTATIFAMATTNRRITAAIAVLYAITLLAMGFLQPLLTPSPELTPNINLAYFVVNAFWISGFILLIIHYAFSQRTKIQKEKADHFEELHRLKNQLFVNIAHEFRSPITAINGMAELLQAQPNEHPQERTSVILRNSNKILHLVEQILSLSRLEEGVMPVQQVRSNIVPFVGFVVGSYTSLAEMKGVSLQFIPEIPEIVMDFDPDKTEEILGNLVSNAIKYTPSGGKVVVTACLQNTPSQCLLLSVTDTGIGIAPHETERIFEPYYRSPDTTQHYEEGSGIGLTLVKAYLKLLNGTITVQSLQGKGSTFTISLPVLQHATFIERVAAFHQPYAEELPAFDVLNNPDELQQDMPLLLIVEDNNDIIAYLRLVLGNKYRILGANNGEDGIQQAIHHVPDVVMTDVMMPQKDGYELCRTLKNDFRTNHIPVVMLTARADLNSRITGFEHGADAYLTKPFQRKELLACLRSLLIQREKLRARYAESRTATPYHKPDADNALPDADLSNQFMEQVNSIIEQNYAQESFGIEELCHQLNISRTQLHRKLMALTGNSASHYLRAKRMEKARHLLLHTDQTISEIAYDTGFSDPNYFTRIFSHHFGKTPSVYRKEHTEAN